MDSGNESPPPRTTILGSFLRGRPRNSSQSHIVLNTADTRDRDLSPASHPPSPVVSGPNAAGHRRSRVGGIGNISIGLGAVTIPGGSGTPAAAAPVPLPSTTTTTTPNSNSNSGLGLHMLRRRRSAGTIAANASPAVPPAPAIPPPQPPAPTTSTAIAVPSTNGTSSNSAFRIRLVPHIDSRRTLRFDAISRELKPGDPALRIGRFTDRSGLGLAAVNALHTHRLAFKSKVVSRAHAELWVEAGGKFYIKDTKSSSGTFLNHVRLSPAGTESRKYAVKDGDIVQLGVDYQGGAEDIYKSVKIRVEMGREWQAGANAFNTNTLKILKTLSAPPPPKPNTHLLPPGASSPHLSPANSINPTPRHSHIGASSSSPSSSPNSIPDCCICLFSVSIRQALFIAPCSHTFHYKCIRPLLESHHPAFSCPLCRTFADLEEDVEVEGDGAEYDQLLDGDVDGDTGGEEGDMGGGVVAEGGISRRPSGDNGGGDVEGGAHTEAEPEDSQLIARTRTPPRLASAAGTHIDEAEEGLYDDDVDMAVDGLAGGVDSEGSGGSGGSGPGVVILGAVGVGGDGMDVDVGDGDGDGQGAAKRKR